MKGPIQEPTSAGILPVATTPPSEKDMPYFNAGVHMDGLTTTGFINDKAPDAAMSTDEYSAAYAEMINANADVRSEASLHRPGRHDRHGRHPRACRRRSRRS